MATQNKKRSVSTSPVTTPVAAAPVRANRSAVAEFAPDYSFIKKDLGQIAILAGSFVVILIVLSFFLR